MPTSTLPHTSSAAATGWGSTNTWASNEGNSSDGWLDSKKGWGDSNRGRDDSGKGWGDIASASEATTPHAAWAGDADRNSKTGWGDSSTWEHGGWGDASPKWNEAAATTPTIPPSTDAAPRWTQAPGASTSQTKQSPPVVFKRFPENYDLHALWDSNYADYVPIRWTYGDHKQMVDTNFERYYWDTIHYSDNQKLSPYIKEASNLSSNRKAHTMLTARLEYYDKRFTPWNHSSHRGLPPVPFVSAAERDRKLRVYVMLRYYYRREIMGREFTSILDGDGDLIMLDR